MVKIVVWRFIPVNGISEVVLVIIQNLVQKKQNFDDDILYSKAVENVVVFLLVFSQNAVVKN